MIARIVSSIRMSVPSLFTIFNMLSGCLAILLSFYDLALAGLMILLAGVFDFIDGLAARVLDAYSDFGKELDSLADMVSFGIAPSFILYHLLLSSIASQHPVFTIDQIPATGILVLSASFLPAIAVSLRLARFNLKSAGSATFSGLPSPASGMFLASSGYLYATSINPLVHELFRFTGLLVAVALILSVLMVVPLPMFSIKFRNLNYRENRIRYVFALPSLLIIIFWGLSSIPVVILYYILLSVAGSLYTKFNRQ